MKNSPLEKIIIDTNASSSAFGWDFQSNAAILFALKNIKELDSLKVEGAIEDIELYLKGNKKIYIQAKSQEDPTPGTNTLPKLRDSLKTLINASNQSDYEKLIYISNIINPLKDKSLDYFWELHYSLYNYDELTQKGMNIVDKYIDDASLKYNLNLSNLNKKNLQIGVIPFYGSDKETRYKIIHYAVRKFIFEANMSEGLSSDVLEHWQNSFFFNSTNRSVHLSKKELIWPLIVIESSVSMDNPFFEDYDMGQIEEIKRKFGEFINKKSEQFDFVIKVMNDYSTYIKNNNHLKPRECTQLFIDNNWHKYSYVVINDFLEIEVKEAIIRLIISQILKKRYCIDNVKRAAGL